MTDVPLPLNITEPTPPPACWYCGLASERMEREHQLPRSRGGDHGMNVVMACVRCNDLKGPLTADEFREGLSERLGMAPGDVVFAGESTPERPFTERLRTVRTLWADRRVTRISPEAGEQLYRAWRYLRTGEPRLTRAELASDAITSHLEALRETLLDGESEWPEPGLRLFEVDDQAVSPTGRRDLSRSPKVPQAREKTTVTGSLLDQARAAVEHRRVTGEPEISLIEWVDQAFRAQLAADAAQFLPDDLDRKEG